METKKRAKIEEIIELDDEAKALVKSYIPGRILGEGAYAKVFHGIHKISEKERAIKLVNKTTLDKASVSRVYEEIRVLSKVNHPNIVNMIEYSENNTKIAIVMELMTGGELFDLMIQEGAFSEEKAVNIVFQIANAVVYLHRKGIVHRDLKPENILLESPSENPRICIADFGFATFIDEKESLSTPCGSLGYFAPEIASFASYKKGVDIWSLGIILYTLLCGFPPFFHEDDDVLLELIAEGEYSFPDPWWADISNAAKDLITKVLEKNPNKRITAEMFLEHPWIKGSTTKLRRTSSKLHIGKETQNMIRSSLNKIVQQQRDSISLAPANESPLWKKRMSKRQEGVRKFNIRIKDSSSVEWVKIKIPSNNLTLESLKEASAEKFNLIQKYLTTIYTCSVLDDNGNPDLQYRKILRDDKDVNLPSGTFLELEYVTPSSFTPKKKKSKKKKKGKSSKQEEIPEETKEREDKPSKRDSKREKEEEEEEKPSKKEEISEQKEEKKEKEVKSSKKEKSKSSKLSQEEKILKKEDTESIKEDKPVKKENVDSSKIKKQKSKEEKVSKKEDIESIKEDKPVKKENVDSSKIKKQKSKEEKKERLEEEVEEKSKTKEEKAKLKGRTLEKQRTKEEKDEEEKPKEEKVKDKKKEKREKVKLKEKEESPQELEKEAKPKSKEEKSKDKSKDKNKEERIKEKEKSKLKEEKDDKEKKKKKNSKLKETSSESSSDINNDTLPKEKKEKKKKKEKKGIKEETIINPPLSETTEELQKNTSSLENQEEMEDSKKKKKKKSLELISPSADSQSQESNDSVSLKPKARKSGLKPKTLRSKSKTDITNEETPTKSRRSKTVGSKDELEDNEDKINAIFKNMITSIRSIEETKKNEKKK